MIIPPWRLHRTGPRSERAFNDVQLCRRLPKPGAIVSHVCSPTLPTGVMII